MAVKFENNSVICKEALGKAQLAWLHEAAGELESQTKRNTKVDTGKTKGSWSYKVDETTGKATIGSPDRNAIWEEFGTGEYALHGDGRKTPWAYKDEKGNWHTTKGKKPRRALWNAFTSLKSQIIRAAEEKFRGVGS